MNAKRESEMGSRRAQADLDNVRGVIRAVIEQLRATGDTGMVPNLLEADDAVAELIEAGKQLLPRNLCLNNPRWPDSTEIPLTTTLGELRAFAAALANAGGAA